MKRILAMLLSVICVLSFTCVSTYADEKSEDEEKAASIAESYYLQQLKTCGSMSLIIWQNILFRN